MNKQSSSAYALLFLLFLAVFFSSQVSAQDCSSGIPVYEGGPAGSTFVACFTGSLSGLLGPPKAGAPVKTVPDYGDGNTPIFFISDSGNTCTSSFEEREAGAITVFTNSGYSPLVFSWVSVTLADGHAELWTRTGGVPKAAHYWAIITTNCP